MWLYATIFTQNKMQKLSRFYSRNLLRAAGCPVTIEGELPQKEPMIFVANHASYIDAIVLKSIAPPYALFIAKKQLLSIPIARTIVKALSLTVDQFDFAKSLEETKTITMELQQGKSIVIFPEGTFTYANGLRPFKLGAFTLAAETSTPICPISVQGTRSILRDESYLFRPGAIKIKIGKAIVPASKEWDEVMRLHTLVRAEIAEHCGEPVIDLVVAGATGRNIY